LLPGESGILPPEPEQVTVQGERLAVTSSFAWVQSAASERVLRAWVRQQRPHGGVRNALELSQKVGSPSAHQSRQARLMIREEEKGTRRRELLAHEEQGGARTQEEEGGQRPPPPGTGQGVQPEPSGGMGDL